jgi:hypothetical protein
VKWRDKNKNFEKREGEKLTYTFMGSGCKAERFSRNEYLWMVIILLKENINLGMAAFKRKFNCS